MKDDTLGSVNGALSGNTYSSLNEGLSYAAPESIQFLR